MAKCVSNEGKVCEYLSFNLKHNYLYHCGFNKDRLVQIGYEDLRRNYPCPLDVGTNPKNIYKDEDS
jgi:hypothetical protein